MTDTIIANLPPDGLRVVLRSILASHPEATSTLERETKSFAEQSASAQLKVDQPLTDLKSLRAVQGLVRCMLGSGLCFQSLPLLSKVVSRAIEGQRQPLDDDEDDILDFYALVDHDIVQAMTAVQKSLCVATGTRALADDERELLQRFEQGLTECAIAAKRRGTSPPFFRGARATAGLLGRPEIPGAEPQEIILNSMDLVQPPPRAKETCLLGRRTIPRIFSGLWQMSSPAWGTAPTSKIVDQISRHVQSGFTAFDMADHYGDAEVIFVSLHFHVPFILNARLTVCVRATSGPPGLIKMLFSRPPNIASSTP